jgi:hypothetical protein
MNTTLLPTLAAPIAALKSDGYTVIGLPDAATLSCWQSWTLPPISPTAGVSR